MRYLVSMSLRYLVSTWSFWKACMVFRTSWARRRRRQRFGRRRMSPWACRIRLMVAVESRYLPLGEQRPDFVLSEARISASELDHLLLPEREGFCGEGVYPAGGR